MTALDALWHLLNAVAAPFGVSALSAGALKLLWRHASTGRSWLGLTLWGYSAALVAHLGVWAYTGIEGTMTGYALMVAACALALWARAFLWSAAATR